ncbi:MAG TPA: trypsin-like peptidase domain-containing protein [Candidatus Micrarchaeaceae archaeon]|nr:trypsin-like peptidase domain-containing protein [Candidatus Micrarchaeaceae archaeon]
MEPTPVQATYPPMQATYWVPPPPPPPPSHSDPHIGRWIIVAFLVAALAAGGSGIGVGWGLANFFRQPSAAVQSPIAGLSPIPIASPTTAPNNGNPSADAIAALVTPAIVDINTVTTSGQAAGTGQILTSDGEVLTNNHVVDGSTSISVVIAGRSGNFHAHVIGVDPARDVALIQIEGVSGLPTITLGSSSSVNVGDPVVAIGNALGLGGAPSVTTGNVTALDQSITASEGGSNSEQLIGMIQSNAPIQPGDSGGAIVNSSGQVVGMITAGDVQGFRSQTSTTNYSVPSDTAISIVNRIRSGEAAADIVYGQVGFMGVSVRDTNAGGAQVVTVQSGSPADSAGISPGAIISKVGGTSITSSAALGTAIRSHKAGDRVSVTWTDSNGSHTTTMTLAGVNP